MKAPKGIKFKFGKIKNSELQCIIEIDCKSWFFQKIKLQVAFMGIIKLSILFPFWFLKQIFSEFLYA
jgi:hypothetical protein